MTIGGPASMSGSNSTPVPTATTRLRPNARSAATCGRSGSSRDCTS